MKTTQEIKHTPEPWESTVPPSVCLTSRHITGPNGEFIAALGLPNGFDNGPFIDSANAARIVACVNACATLPDPAVVPELVAALRRCYAELHRLQEVHLPKYEGKIGEPDIETIVGAGKALARCGKVGGAP